MVRSTAHQAIGSWAEADLGLPRAEALHEKDTARSQRRNTLAVQRPSRGWRQHEEHRDDAVIDACVGVSHAWVMNIGVSHT